MFNEKEIYGRAKGFALQIIRLAATFQRNSEALVISRQLIRSATSIGANLAEASVARSRMEFGSVLGISLKEAKETIYWLELAQEISLAECAKLAGALDEGRQISRILAAIVMKVRREN